MRKIIVMTLITATLLTGCASADEESITAESDKKSERFEMIEEIESDGNWYGSNDWSHVRKAVIRDTQTGVEYLFIDTGLREGGITITPLYNADGTLKKD